MKRSLAAAGAALALLTACRQPVIERVPDASVSFTPPPVTSTPTLRAEGPSASCVKGWREPAPDSRERTAPLDVLRASQGFEKDFHPVDLRYFTGPEARTERWYGQVIWTGKPDFLIRFLAQRVAGGDVRIVAIADYGTTGFSSPDWYGFDGSTGKNSYPGLPGMWPGKPFDYAQSGQLPAEVRGCLR